MKDHIHQCKFCQKRFVLEDRFFVHRCKQMIRDEEFRTPIGQLAWGCYQKWMKEHRRMIPPPSTFIQSKFYNSFIRFAKFSKKAQIPDIHIFIWLMKEKNISPTIWANEQVYTIYLEFIDKKATPEKHVQITVNTLFKIAEKSDIDVSEVFDIIEPNDVIGLFRQRRLSPWLLLHSTKFRDFFVNKLSNEQRIIVETIVRPQYWAQRFKDHPELVEQMKKYISELNL